MLNPQNYNKIWVTSDDHAFHRSILKFCPKSRHGKDHIEMTNLRIEQWNKQVDPNDLVFNLGDVSFADYSNTLKYVNSLNGSIYLVRGNHDNVNRLRGTKRFIGISDTYEMSHKGTRIFMSHYPHLEWPQMHYGSIHLYGHVHGKDLPALHNTRSMDVGVDTRTDMGLYLLDDVINTLCDRPYKEHQPRT